MIKYGLKDFGYDEKLYKKYLNGYKLALELKKAHRLKAKAYLLKCAKYGEDDAYVLKKKR